MAETTAEKPAQKWGLIAGGLVALFLLNRWRQKRKVKKILKARAKVSAQAEKVKRKEGAKVRGKRGEKKGKERSMVEQLLRFAVFQFMKKVISEQIKQMEVDLAKGKLGKKLAEVAEKA